MAVASARPSPDDVAASDDAGADLDTAQHSLVYGAGYGNYLGGYGLYGAGYGGYLGGYGGYGLYGGLGYPLYGGGLYGRRYGYGWGGWGRR